MNLIYWKSSFILKRCDKKQDSYLMLEKKSGKGEPICLLDIDLHSNEIQSAKSNLILKYHSSNDQSSFGFIANYKFFTGKLHKEMN